MVKPMSPIQEEKVADLAHELAHFILKLDALEIDVLGGPAKGQTVEARVKRLAYAMNRKMEGD
jgi:hypothetical protein